MIMKKEEAQQIIDKLNQIHSVVSDSMPTTQNRELAQENIIKLLAIFMSPNNKLIYPYNR